MDIHFNGYKVKYPLLTYNMMDLRRSMNIKNINIFIDLDDLFHTLHRPAINREFQICGKNAGKQVVSNIMNLAGHYRNWAIKEKLNPRIFLIYSKSRKLYKNGIYLSGYRQRFYDINSETNGDNYFINMALRESYDIMHVLCKYIEGVYIIDSKYLEPSIIPLYLVENGFKSDWNIIVSRDTYMLQYACRDKFTMISPKGENSTFINIDNMWNYVNLRDRVYKNEEVDLHFSPDLFVIAKAIVGDRYRSIPRLRKIGWKTLFNYISKVSSDESTDNIGELQRNKLVEFIVKKGIEDDELNNNLMCVSIDSQVGSLLDTDKSVINNQIEDLADYEALKQVNNDIFREFPINLNFLCNKLLI